MAQDANSLIFKVKSAPEVIMHTVTDTAGSDNVVDLTTSGSYVLVFSNCGDQGGLAVSGTVEVKNPWGFLPAIEFHKTSLYGCLMLFYICTTIFWFISALRWWRQLLYIQKCMLGLNILCLLEVVAWYVFYTSWNSSGKSSLFVFIVAGLAACCKMMLSFWAALFTSADGEKDGEEGSMCGFDLKVHIALMLYMVADFNMRLIMAFRYSRALSFAYILLNSIPAMLIGLGIFIWVHMSLMSYIQKLRERKDEANASFYQKLQGVLVLALLAAGLTVLLQIFDSTVDDQSRWGSHFFMSDGLGQLSYALIFGLAIIVAAPRESIQGYEYSSHLQVEGAVVGAPTAIFGDEDCDSDGGGNQVSPSGKSSKV